MIPAAAASGGTQHLRRFTVTVVGPPPPPPAAGLDVTHTGNASRVQIDTTGLWQSQGGDVPSSATAAMDGLTDPKWTQPTPAAPVVTWLVPTGVHTFTLAAGGTTYYATTLDVYYRTYPWTSSGGGKYPENDTYFAANGGDWPHVTDGPFVSLSAWRNRYSIVPDTGATSCVFCVAPGDNDPGVGDNRSEPNLQDNWNPADKPGFHLNLLGNLDSSVIFWRFDYAIPSSWTAPVTVQNANNPAGWAEARGKNSAWLWPNTSNINPATGDFTASATVINDLTKTAPSTSNMVENQGPATFKIGGGANDGSLFTMYQPYSLGVIISTQKYQNRQPVLDQRYCNIIEWCPDLTATTDGVPWIVPPGTITSPRATAWSNTNNIAPYGVPPGVPGGGYFRIWESLDEGVTWTCATAGTSFAVPGTPTINADGTISGGDAGKVFGPTIKCNGAKLATPITAGQGPPFNVTLSNQVLGSGFGGIGVLSADGHVWIGNERFRFSSFNQTSKVMTITARADRDTAAVAHAVGEQVAGPADYPIITAGMNTTGGTLKIPFAAREWPILVGRTFASVANVNDA